MPTIEDLREMQAMSLDEKVLLTQRRIEEFYWKNKGNVYVSFSGGKDSTVLLHIARKLFPDVEAVFCNTGLEFPEIRQHALSFDNVREIRPLYGRRASRYGKRKDDVIPFMDVVSIYGYPIISKAVSNCISRARINSDGSRMLRLKGEYGEKKNKFDTSRYLPLFDLPFKVSEECCSTMKKSPSKAFEKMTGKKPIVGTMTCESDFRETSWTKTGCNSYGDRAMSRPMSFWMEQDVLRYIVENNIPICSVYGEIVSCDENGNEYGCTLFDTKLSCSGYKRTGCMFCSFGAHLEKGETRYQRLKKTHPKIYEYCMGGGGGLITKSTTVYFRKTDGTRSSYGCRPNMDLAWVRYLT